MRHHFLSLCRTDTTFGFFISQFFALIFNVLRIRKKNGDSLFATIPDADALILRQILRLTRVRDTWDRESHNRLEKEKNYENALFNSS